MNLLYLADLTHTGQLVASNVMPLGIGLIGATVRRDLGWEVELFKYPQDLDQALQRRQPDVIGFANYSWNQNLGMEYAKKIRATWSSITIIAGGPNYGSTEEEQGDFWRRFGDYIDYYIYREGEQATVALLKLLETDACGTSGSVHRLLEGRIQRNPNLPRIRSLEEIPSPYLAGLMDKFFDGILIPLIHTTRGCPFKCTFCQEGADYYDSVAKRTTLSEELQYIGSRKGSIDDLYISDANFGMFREDRDKARIIADTQREYGWPQYIHVSGGKNHKERLLEVADIIGGRMGVAASLQSTDKAVLGNVRRQNISVEQLTDVARNGSRIDANTYAEIILNLPGDTVAAHSQSLRDATNSGLSYVRMYQLIMLPDTEMNTRETRERFSMVTKWRIMPRCFGKYSFNGKEFNCAEIEEICVAQHSLSFQQYLDCRELDLTVEIAHNANVFRELYGLCQVAGVEWFSLLLGYHENRRHLLGDLYREFRENTVRPLWDSREEALSFAQENVQDYIDEKAGTNELFNAKAVAFFRLQYQLHDALYSVAMEMMPQYTDYLMQCKHWSLCRKAGLLEMDHEVTTEFDYDFPALLDADFTVDPNQHKRKCRITFRMDEAQKDILRQLIRQYGTTTTGLGRILLRAHVKKLFRQVEHDGITTSKGFETSYRRTSNLAGD